MKKYSKLLFLFLLTCSLFAILGSTVFAANEVSWYFKKNNEHKQPLLDPPLEFINKYSCYYVDKAHGNESEDKVIYLTFDAGYENGNVEKILDVLKERNVKGAFFVLGHLINNNTDLVIRMSEEGHLVCNHTVSHKNMSVVSDESVFIKELQALEMIYQEKTGKIMPKYYRPPEGRISESNLQILEKYGYKTILWSFAYADWDNEKQMSPEKALEKLINGVHNGEILLLHPTSATNAEILGAFIDDCIAKGYRFGTLDELG